jgi:hypothetical protein
LYDVCPSFGSLPASSLAAPSLFDDGVAARLDCVLPAGVIIRISSWERNWTRFCFSLANFFDANDVCSVSSGTDGCGSSFLS